MAKIIRKQKKPYGCGFYSLANLFDSDEFEKLGENEDLCKNGNDSYQLNLFLMEKGIAIFPLYQNLIFSISGTIGLVDTKDSYLPFFLAISPIDNKKNHMVSGKMFPDGSVEIYDSLRDEVVFAESVNEYVSMNEVSAIHALYGVDFTSGGISSYPLLVDIGSEPKSLLERDNSVLTKNDLLPEFFKNL